MIYWIRFVAPVGAKMKWEKGGQKVAEVISNDRFVRLRDGTARERLVPMSNVAEICQDSRREESHPYRSSAKTKKSDAMTG